MALRKQQQKLKDLVLEIQNGNSEIKEIFLSWGVGSGKSLSPVILSDLLINNKKQVVVVPRNSLKTQGEVEYNNDIYPVDKIARIADNCGDPFRGCDSCFGLRISRIMVLSRALNISRSCNRLISMIAQTIQCISCKYSWLSYYQSLRIFLALPHPIYRN